MNTTTLVPSTIDKQSVGKKPLGASVGIPPRRVNFDFSKTTVPHYFFGNSAFKTTFMLAMSSTFPEGELMFVKSVKLFRDRISDPKLKAEIAGFIGQEALHSQAHLAFDAVAEQHGFSLKKLEEMHGRSMKLTWKLFSPKARLAFTAGVEHLTAILAELMLCDKSTLASMSPEARQLFLWHSLEETEHKAVAYDVYQTIGGGYSTRVLMMLYGVVGFLTTSAIFQARLLAEDPRPFSLRDYVSGFNFLFGPKGKFLPMFPMLLDYFRPNFHPNQHDTNPLLEQWREELFGLEGSLSAQYPQGQLVH